MPYKKRYSRKQGKATRYMNTASKALATGTAALHLARQLKGLVNVEKHRHITSANAQSVTSSGTVINLTGISQGDDAADRQGNSILCKGLSAKISLQHNTANTHSVVRFIWFIDTQQIGDTTPAVTDVLESASVVAPLNRTTIGRFKILKNKIYTMSNTGNMQHYCDKYLPLNHHVRYNGSAITDLQKGGVYFLYISNEATNYPSMDYTTITQFYDN